MLTILGLEKRYYIWNFRHTWHHYLIKFMIIKSHRQDVEAFCTSRRCEEITTLASFKSGSDIIPCISLGMHSAFCLLFWQGVFQGLPLDPSFHNLHDQESNVEILPVISNLFTVCFSSWEITTGCVYRPTGLTVRQTQAKMPHITWPPLSPHA